MSAVKRRAKETGELFNARLATKWLGQKIFFYKELSSTQQEAKRLLSKAPTGLVIWADRQTQGKGRFSRKWYSPRGAGLYFSLILKEPLIRPLSLYSLATAIGVVLALEEELGIPFNLKWPNDLILNNRKVGGILIENISSSLIVGIGINVSLRREDFPLELKKKATSIWEETGLAPSRTRLLRTILRSLEDIYEKLLSQGFKAIEDPWKKRDIARLSKVVLKKGDTFITGVALGPASDGSLLLKTTTGKILSLSSGEIILWEIPAWENQAA